MTTRKDVNTGFSELRGDVREGFVTFKKEIVGEVRDIVREGTIKTLASNDKVALKLDKFLEDRAAHDALHERITDDLHVHNQRIQKLEAKI